MSDNAEISKILLSQDNLVELGLNYSNSHQLRLEADGMFPKRVRISPQKVFWLADEIEAWIAQQSAKRGGADNA